MADALRTVLRAVGYAATFLAGAALFVPDPTGALVAVPVGCGWAVTGHALATDRERALARTAVGFVGVLLVLAIFGAGLAGPVGAERGSTTTVAQLVTTLGGAAGVLALYAALVADLPARLRGGEAGS